MYGDWRKYLFVTNVLSINETKLDSSFTSNSEIYLSVMILLLDWIVTLMAEMAVEFVYIILIPYL